MAIRRLVEALALGFALMLIASCGGGGGGSSGGGTTGITIGGTVSGLTGGTLVLQFNGTNNVTITANGSYTFSVPLANGSPYSVTVLTQPTGETCAVANGSGTVTGTNVTNIFVTCATSTFSVGGTVSGLTSGTLVLQLNGTNSVTITANGSYTFSVPLVNGSPYSVTVLTQPAGETCTVANGSDTVTGTNVTNIIVTCATSTFSVGGTISGLTGTVVLRDISSNDLSRSTNGAFTFSVPLANLSPYNVTVLTQPTGQICKVTNGTGTVSGSNVTSVSVTCVAGFITNFPLTENPISEGGKWINGKVVGLDWNNVKTVPGRATGSVLLGASRYADDIAILSDPAFAANQYSQGTVYLAPGYSPPGNHEVELLLRFSISAQNAHGYEVLWGRAGYMAIVRWNGPLGDYTPLYENLSFPVPIDGDVLKAQISGNNITVYRNGSSVVTVNIGVAGGTIYSTGQPGIGFWPVDGATPENYGWKTFEAGNLP